MVEEVHTACPGAARQELGFRGELYCSFDEGFRELLPTSLCLWGSSNQIFHAFVLIAVITHLYGMTKAFDYHHTVIGSECLAE